MITRLALLSYFLLLSGWIFSNSKDTICGKQYDKFINEKNLFSCQKMLNSGCSICLLSDKTSLFIQIQAKQPMVQMKMLMLGFTLFIDPKGKKKERYAINFPNAKDVKEEILGLETDGINPRMNQTKNIKNNSVEFERPDIRPLIAALNLKQVKPDDNGNIALLPLNCSNITLLENEKEILFQVLIPVSFFAPKDLAIKSLSIGIYSENTPPESLQEPPGNRMNPPDNPPIQHPDDDIFKKMNEWIRFDYEKLIIK